MLPARTETKAMGAHAHTNLAGSGEMRQTNVLCSAFDGQHIAYSRLPVFTNLWVVGARDTSFKSGQT